MKLSVIIPAFNEEKYIERCVGSIARALEVHAARLADNEIIVTDNNSTDATAEVARRAGAKVVLEPVNHISRARNAGAAVATGEMLLFLHADTVLDPGWAAAAAAFMAATPQGDRAAYFRFALDDPGPAARRLERLVAWRCRALALPYGDQGLLIHRTLYAAVGGFRPLPLFEDVDMARRLTRARLVALDVAAVTSARRYLRSGYLLRPARNLCCLSLYFMGLPPRLIARIYR